MLNVCITYKTVEVFKPHTILYKKGSRNPNTAKIVDARMNKAISHSCIRLMPDNAKYIFSSVPNNTRVIVFDWDGK